MKIGDVQAVVAEAVFVFDVGAYNDQAVFFVLGDVLLVPGNAFLVEVGGGFVEQQEGGFGVDSQPQLQALLHAGRKVFHELMTRLYKAHPLGELFLGELPAQGLKTGMESQHLL